MDQNQFQTEGGLARHNSNVSVSAPASEETQEIDLLLLFNALRRHILIIIAVALVFALVAGIVVQFFITPLYTATTSTYLVSASGNAGGTIGQLLQATDLTLSNNILGDYSDIIKSRTILEAVIERMNREYDIQVEQGQPTTLKEKLDLEYEDFYEMVEVTNPTDTHIIKITVTDDDPVRAKDIANYLTHYAVDRLADIMQISVPNVYDEAVVADRPAYPSLTKTVVIAFVLGAVLACGVIIFIAVMDTTVKTAEDIENRCGMVTLTKVYYEGGKKKKGYGYGSYGSYGYGYGYYGSGSSDRDAGSKGHKSQKTKTDKSEKSGKGGSK